VPIIFTGEAVTPSCSIDKRQGGGYLKCKARKIPPSASHPECESFDDEGITFTAKACEDLHHVTPTYEPRDTSGDKSRDTPTHSKK